MTARRRSGFTLLEALGLMAALALVATVLVVTLAGALRLETASEEALDHFVARRDLADQFRADVAGADEAPPRWQDEAAGPDCLILALGKDHHVVYRLEEQRLVRYEVEGKEPFRRRELAPVGESVELEFGRPRGGLITLRVIKVRKDGMRQPAAEFVAALGGDRQ